MTTLLYTMVSPLKNTVVERQNISNFVEKEHGFYFEWQGTKNFVNWSYVAQYSLVEE